MAISYPDFSADPNSVPKINGIPGIIDGIQKGYMLAQLPEKMRNEREQMRLSTERAQMENQYYPQMQKAQIGELQGRSSLYAAQGQSAQIDAQQKRALYDALQRMSQQPAQQGYGAPAPQPASQGGYAQPPQSGMPPQDYGKFNLLNGLVDQARQSPGGGGYYNSSAGSPAQSNAPSGGYYNSPAQQGYGAPQVVDPGDPSLYNIDELYRQNPMLRGQLNDMGFKKTTDTQIDPNGRIISTTVYPSGKKESYSTGPTVEQAEYLKERGKGNAAAYDESLKTLDTTIQAGQLIDETKSFLDDPDFANSVGPLNQAVNKIGWGSPKAQRLTGSIESITREIQSAKAAALKLGGGAAASKLAFVNSLKPSTDDTKEAFIGKLEAVNTFNKWLGDYSSFMSNAIDQGVSRDKAMKEADKAFPIAKYRGEILDQVKRGEIAGDLREKGFKVSRDDEVGYRVAVPDPVTGKTLHVAVEDYDKWLADYKSKRNGK
jgi:hypothetical protein